MSTKPKFPTLKDYLYGMGLMLMLLVFVGAHFLGSSTSLANKLSFSATVVSIILAVIAIVISLIESVRNSKANENILESSETIEEVTNILNRSTEQLSKLSIQLGEIDLSGELKSLNEKVDSSNNDIKTFLNEYSTTSKEIKESHPSIEIDLSNILKDNLEVKLVDELDNSEHDLISMLYYIHKSNFSTLKELVNKMYHFVEFLFENRTLFTGQFMGTLKIMLIFKIVKDLEGKFVVKDSVIQHVLQIENKQLFEKVDKYIQDSIISL